MCGYVICEDLQKGSSTANVKVHPDFCSHYRNRKINAPTMKWHSGFRTVDEALKQATVIAREYNNKPVIAQRCTKPRDG